MVGEKRNIHKILVEILKVRHCLQKIRCDDMYWIPLKLMVFRDITPCNLLLVRHRRFELSMLPPSSA